MSNMSIYITKNHLIERWLKRKYAPDRIWTYTLFTRHPGCSALVFTISGVPSILPLSYRCIQNLVATSGVNPVRSTIYIRIFKIIKTKVNVINYGVNMFYNIRMTIIFFIQHRGNFVNGNTGPSFNISIISRTFTNHLIISIKILAISFFTNFHCIKDTRLSIVRNISEIITRNTIFSTTNQDNGEYEKEKFFHCLPRRCFVFLYVNIVIYMQTVNKIMFTKCKILFTII